MRTLLTLVLLVLTSGAARAQLDLPEKLGKPKPPPLEAPKASASTSAAASAPTGAPAEVVKPEPAAPAPALATFSSAAAFVLDEIQRVSAVNSPMIDHAVRSLGGLGEDGRAAAMQALASKHGPTVLVGARVLLATGVAADGELVTARLSQPLPANVGDRMVDALVELDPMRAQPRLLAELLGHPQTGVRNSAQRHLASLPPDDIAAALPVALAHRMVDARVRAVQIATDVPGPAALEILLRTLGDRSSEVARKCILALALREDERVSPELLRRAFAGPWVLRHEAFALLAIIEREDRRLEPILGDQHAEHLLRGMSTKDPFLAGVCAAALAGIGFRSVDPRTAEWLDRQVPDRLVRAVSGQEFHNDFSLVQEVASRRLTLLSGATHGSDGARWVSWWAEHGETFRPRRCVLAVTPEDAPRMRVQYLSTSGGARAFELLGPGHAPQHFAGPRAGATALLLSEQQAREAFALLRTEGLFSAERIPGARASDMGATRTLEIDFDGRSKSFRFGGGRSEPWFERCAALVEALEGRNRWQLYPDPALAAASPEERLQRWREESAWWDAEHTEAERMRRLITAALAAQVPLRPSERDAGIAEVARHAAHLEVSDFVTLVALLEQERFLGPRTRVLVELAQRAATLPDGGVDPALSGRLLEGVEKTFGADGAAQMVAILQRSGPATVREAGASQNPLLRAVAAVALAREPGAEGIDLLLKLLDDPVLDVQRSAALALGEARVKEAEPKLAARARLSEPLVRTAALEALGLIGGELAFDALLEGLTQRESPEVAAAAAKGFGSLGDGRAAPLLITLVGRGPNDAAYEPARAALAQLGDKAQPELLRVLNSGANRSKREAALLLSEQCVAQAAPVLMMILTDAPGDKRVAEELAVLTCVDFRDQAAPAQTWWAWWEGVVRDQPLAWLCGSLQRLGVAAPPIAALAGEGSREGAAFLLEVLRRDEAYLAERARRELARLLATEPGPLPPPGEGRRKLAASLQAQVEERWK